DVADPGRAVDLQIGATTDETRDDERSPHLFRSEMVGDRANDLVAVADREGMRGRAGSAVALAAVAADLAVVVAEAGTGVAELAEIGRASCRVGEVGRVAGRAGADAGAGVDLESGEG